jgi:hypothetical protein
LQDPPKFTQIGIFGLKTDHLATLASRQPGPAFCTENKLDLFLKNSPGLPDGFFSKQKSKFGQILEGLRWEILYIFWSYLEYFMTIWYILCSFGTFFRFWYHVPRKILQP